MTKKDIKKLEEMYTEMLSYCYDPYGDVDILKTHKKTDIINAANMYISHISEFVCEEEDKLDGIRLEDKKAIAEEIVGYLNDFVEALEEMIEMFEYPMFKWEAVQELWEEACGSLIEVVHLAD